MTNHQCCEQSVTSQIDELFAKWDQLDSPGAAVIIIRDGEVIHEKGYGSAQLEYDLPITPTTIFHVASVSKQFTTMSILLLADEGKLSLDEDIQHYLPWVPQFDHNITIRHLIHHTSGLRDQWALLRLAGWRMDDVITTEHIKKMVRHQRDLNFPPGEEHLYSNTGYTLMAEIIQQVTGKSLREFARERIFEPLDMNRTHFHDDHQEIVPDRAYSYSENENSGYQKSILSYANIGATSLFTTVEDLAKWLVNFDQQLVGNAKVMERMHERYVLNNGETISYAGGVSYTEHRGLQMIGHGGADAGFRSYCGRFAEHNLGIVILSNLATCNPGSLAKKIGEICLSEHLDKPSPEKQNADLPPADSEEMKQCTGTYVLSPYGLIRVSYSESGFTIKRGKQSPVKLIPDGGLNFKVEGRDQQVSFKQDDAGKITSLEYILPGRTLNAQKKQMPCMSRDELTEFEADYFSPELRTTYSFVAEDGKLVMKHQRHEDTEIVPLDENTFMGKGRRPGKIMFKEDSAGQIMGFELTAGRIRNVKFNRIGE